MYVFTTGQLDLILIGRSLYVGPLGLREGPQINALHSMLFQMVGNKSFKCMILLPLLS